MKNIRKIAITMLSLIMIICFSATCYADITITGNDLESFDNTNFGLIGIANGESKIVSITVTNDDTVTSYINPYSLITKTWANTWFDNTVDLKFTADEKSIPWINQCFIQGEDSKEEAWINIITYDNDKRIITDAKNTNKGVKISWTKSKCDSDYYKVQYKEKDGKWKTVAKCHEEASYTFKNLKKGKTYCFRVRPVHPFCFDEEYMGPWSKSFSYKVK